MCQPRVLLRNQNSQRTVRGFSRATKSALLLRQRNGKDALNTLRRMSKGHRRSQQKSVLILLPIAEDTPPGPEQPTPGPPEPEQPTPKPPQPEIPPGGPEEPHLPSPGPEPLPTPVPGPTDPAVPRPILAGGVGLSDERMAPL